MTTNSAALPIHTGPPMSLPELYKAFQYFVEDDETEGICELSSEIQDIAKQYPVAFNLQRISTTLNEAYDETGEFFIDTFLRYSDDDTTSPPRPPHTIVSGLTQQEVQAQYEEYHRQWVGLKELLEPLERFWDFNDVAEKMKEAVEKMKGATKKLEGLAGTYAILCGNAVVNKIESQDRESCLERLRNWQAGVVKVC